MGYTTANQILFFGGIEEELFVMTVINCKMCKLENIMSKRKNILCHQRNKEVCHTTKNRLVIEFGEQKLLLSKDKFFCHSRTFLI